VFVLSSIAEGTPVTLLEAMACALPTVCTRVGGIPDLVAEHHTGQLVPARDPQAMAQALASYVEAPLLAKEHGIAGRRRVEARYSIDAMLASYMALYDRLLASKTTLNQAIEPCAE
jgi:glycosyltransferase involved in cell wall biosynthesis